MEEEWEEEEQLVVAELSGMIDSDVLSKCEGTCKIVGLESDRPMVQVGRYVLAGEYEDAVGTCVLFGEDQTGPSTSVPGLKYKCHTMKKLMLQRTFLSERKEGEPSSGGIEILSLNEGEVAGRASTVCHYVLDPKELQRLRAENDGAPGMSDESDTAETEQSSTKEDDTVKTTETTENVNT